MWQCQACGEELEDHFEACWSCSASRNAASATSRETADAGHAAGTEVGGVDAGSVPEQASGARRQKAVPAASPPETAYSPTTEKHRKSPSVAVRARYKDAYSVAHATVSHGGFIKAVGIAFGALIALVGLTMMKQLGIVVLIASAVAGVFVASVVYSVGLLVAAQGQVLLASLDTAVNGSPFLSEAEKAKVMSL